MGSHDLVTRAIKKAAGEITQAAFLILGIGRGERIRTSDHLHPIQVRYQAALRPEIYRICCECPLAGHSFSLKMARPRRLERPTFGSGGQRSIQLSYGRAERTIIQDHQSLNKFRSCASEARPRSRLVSGSSGWRSGHSRSSCGSSARKRLGSQPIISP